MKHPLAAAVLAAAFGVFVLPPAHAAVSSVEAARLIRESLEKKIPDLSVEKQGHLSIRLYRITGDPRYVESIRPYAQLVQKKLSEYVRGLDSPGYVETVAAQLMRPPANPSRKSKMRRRALEGHEPLVFDRRLLFLAYQARSLGLESGPAAADYGRAVAHLSGVRLEDLYLDPTVVRYNATRATNALKYLETVGLSVRREEYEQLFRKTFLEGSDEILDSVEFLNKIYGMTHFIIADSDFYQRHVPAEKYAWIFEYFDAEIDQIIARTNVDVVSEVGLCYKLAGLTGRPAVEKAKQYVLDRFEYRQGLVSNWASSGTEEVEHRNIVAYLLLSDWQSLHEGPRL